MKQNYTIIIFFITALVFNAEWHGCPLVQLAYITTSKGNLVAYGVDVR